MFLESTCTFFSRTRLESKTKHDVDTRVRAPALVGLCCTRIFLARATFLVNGSSFLLPPSHAHRSLLRRGVRRRSTMMAVRRSARTRHQATSIYDDAKKEIEEKETGSESGAK